MADPPVPTKRQHPTLSDVALALATRRSDPLSKVTLSDANAKGVVQITVESANTDLAVSARETADVYDTLRARYPRENGGDTK